jgi:hypothetical protein
MPYFTLLPTGEVRGIMSGGLVFEGLQQPIDSPVATDTGPSLAVFSPPNSEAPLLYAAWKGSGGDERIWYSSFDGTSWAPQQSLPDPIRTSTRPSLTVLPWTVFSNPVLYAAWKGGDGDERIWYSSFDGTSWASQEPLPSPIASSVGPSLAAYTPPDSEGTQVYAAWKGSDDDERIWYSSLNGTAWSAVNTSGAPQAPLPSPIASSVGPSLAVFNNVLYAAWKGSDGDETLWYSSYGAVDTEYPSWSLDVAGTVQAPLQSPIASSVGPSLVAFSPSDSEAPLLYAAWKGGDGDERIWYSCFDGTSWGIPGGPVQEPFPSPIATDTGPSLAVFNNRLYAAWKGSGGDTRIWWTSATW